MKVKEILKSCLIIFLLIILIDVGYSKFVLKEQPVKLFGKSILIVTTGSMEPTINAGELIVISEENDYFLNDIVTYVDFDGFLITHRIIEKDNNEIITRGDGNNINDEKINLSNIKGKVIFHSEILGFFVLYLLKPLIIIYLIILIIVNFVLIKKDNSEDEKKIEEEKKDDKKIEEVSSN